MVDRAALTLIVFARAPVVGRAKTRLAAAVGAEAACALHRAFVDDTCRLVAGAAARVVLAVDDPADGWLRQIAARDGLALAAQGDGDLGARLARAFAGALGGGPVVIVGSDAPTLPRAQVDGALRLARDNEVMLGPATDGGYWAIGLTRAAPRLFDGIAWGGPSVLVDTLARLDGARAALAPFWYDVDDADDLRLLAAHLPLLAPEVAPATRAAVAGLALS